MLKMTGFDGLAKKMDEAAKALSNLDGEIATVSCDPKDPISIERAIQQVCATIEKKIEPWAENPIVVQMAEGLKERYRVAILERASAARLGASDNGAS